MKNYDIQIARLIMEAQHSSDLAKESYDYRDLYYSLKDECIFKALNLIARSKNSAFRYSVTESKVNGDHCFIVYFSTKIGGVKKVKKQVSFHNFSSGLERYISAECKTRWDEKSSREAAVDIAKHYNVLTEAYRSVEI